MDFSYGIRNEKLGHPLIGCCQFHVPMSNILVQASVCDDWRSRQWATDTRATKDDEAKTATKERNWL